MISDNIIITGGLTFPVGTTYGKTSSQVDWQVAPQVDPSSIVNVIDIKRWMGKCYPAGTRSVICLHSGSIIFTPLSTKSLDEFFSGLGIDTCVIGRKYVQLDVENLSLMGIVAIHRRLPNHQFDPVRHAEVLTVQKTRGVPTYVAQFGLE